MPKIITKELFINKSNIVHNNKYDYSKSIYISAKTKVIIICPEHGDFEQQPTNHYVGKGCYYCGLKILHNYFTKSQEKFISEIIELFGSKYTFGKVKYINDSTELILTCVEHGDFNIKPCDILRKGFRCPKCRQSEGERIIEKFLFNNNIEYKAEHKFNDCFDKAKLRFDFYLPNENICIEYDGEQHFKPIKCFGGEQQLKSQKQKDKIKNDYCLINKILLIRIPYSEIRNINKILMEKLIHNP